MLFCIVSKIMKKNMLNLVSQVRQFASFISYFLSQDYGHDIQVNAKVLFIAYMSQQISM